MDKENYKIGGLSICQVKFESIDIKFGQIKDSSIGWQFTIAAKMF